MELTYNSDVAWTVEYRGIRLFNRRLCKTLFLSYPDAALWDFLIRKIPVERIVPMMSSINFTDKENTELWIKNTIDEWMEGNWVVEK